ncbi:hypothetical protein SAMN05421858_4828 [Haladaptatus litoreus]|uniref:Uncharacterized protein n=1 Tax=Haladaptatus litoreus TaxID=553468 RepID=A0A1N7F8V6_9EURY|nr:hypothetical protein [Haladaptatus litoreus]SIR96763.1 hypothetical protein SAMN05421858_4828 [Haladaptatus litoreus]
MSATTDSVTQSHQLSPKNVQKTFWTDSQGDAQLDALAALNDCSQGALLRSLVDQAFTEQFDELEPAHIEHNQVSVEDLQALANGELTVEELDLTTNTPEPVTEYEPDSYYLTVTPDDLAEPGPELDWETLRDAVKNPEEGGYWNDELEIHESRIGDTTLKASHLPAARILAGLARSNAYENGIVPRATIDDLVDEYCLHLTNRLTADEQERGKAHIRETYTTLITDHLYENPSPVADSYFCTKTQRTKRLQAEVNTAHRLAQQADTITDFETWKLDEEERKRERKQTRDTSESDAGGEVTRDQWFYDLHHWVTEILQAKYIGRTYAMELRRDAYDIPTSDADDRADRNADNDGKSAPGSNEDDTPATAFDALHEHLRTARTAFGTLPADVKAEVIEDLDDALLAAARFD